MDCKNTECENYWSCKMLRDRFNVIECGNVLDLYVNALHKEEFEEREEMLKKVSK